MSRTAGRYFYSKGKTPHSNIQELFFLYRGGTQHPLGPENPLKSIDCTGPGGAEPPQPPPEYASEYIVIGHKIFICTIHTAQQYVQCTYTVQIFKHVFITLFLD